MAKSQLQVNRIHARLKAWTRYKEDRATFAISVDSDGTLYGLIDGPMDISRQCLFSLMIHEHDIAELILGAASDFNNAVSCTESAKEE